MTVCPQCGYERKNNDDNFVSNEECPKCGIYYKKWAPAADSTESGNVTANQKSQNIIEEKNITSFHIVIAILGLIAYASPNFLIYCVFKLQSNSDWAGGIRALMLMMLMFIGYFAGTKKPMEKVWVIGLFGISLFFPYRIFECDIYALSCSSLGFEEIFTYPVFWGCVAFGALIGRKIKRRSARKVHGVVKYLPAKEDIKTKIYSPNQILVGTLFGGPLAGMHFLKSNFDALAKNIASWITIIFFFPFSILLLAFLPLAPKYPVIYSLLPFMYITPVIFVNRIFQLSKRKIMESDRYDFQPAEKVLLVSVTWFFVFSFLAIIVFIVLYYMGFKLGPTMR